VYFLIEALPLLLATLGKLAPRLGEVPPSPLLPDETPPKPREHTSPHKDHDDEGRQHEEIESLGESKYEGLVFVSDAQILDVLVGGENLLLCPLVD
jgi:hypothetical protein